MFKPVTLEWNGKPVTIPANQMLGAIAEIEGVITLNELMSFSARGAYPAARVARAYGALLRYAGVLGDDKLPVSDESVYGGLFGDGEATAAVVGSMQLLIMMMVPPSMRNADSVKPVLAPGEKVPVGNGVAASRSRSSKRSTRSSSRSSGARR